MATPVQTLPSQINGGGPAASVVTANSRVSTASGTLGIQTDVPQFSGPMVTGAWLVAASRTFVNNIPVITQASTGTAASPVPATAPMSVTMGEARVSAT